jgi:hypothetical protein
MPLSAGFELLRSDQFCIKSPPFCAAAESIQRFQMNSWLFNFAPACSKTDPSPGHLKGAGKQCLGFLGLDAHRFYPTV